MTVRHLAVLTCQEVVERVSDLLGADMALDERVRLEQHLLVCPPCTMHVRQMRTTIELAAELRTVDGDGTAAAEVASARSEPSASAAAAEAGAAAALALFREWRRT